ncbi:MAG: Xanthine and CO dehydrogenases maturation factor, XdhC/CoxF family [Candidatus Bipolaricaulis sibiricus]|uniref:Xanthine and CO dehydrogenases maturation factor, XdhC/CoxF family n=1 Tax=Bipolaricaulis sibiricus TaxID=2501609 RepID=A0A410FUP8_BIPS1|nr:MAG: Xanthine and CO dehydrogenases maturation factor, XdhC/CoxF family [Candidatus Bipolaricaulis sibiricus]
MAGQLLARAADLVARGGRAVLVTLVAVDGPAPRLPGARMLVFPDGKTEGTVGGGSLEAHAIGRAQGLLASDGTALETVDFTDRGLKCGGGKATLFYEVLAPEAELVVLGAGHVGRALARLAGEVAAFPVKVYDGRPPCGDPEPEVNPIPGYREIPPLGESAYVVICTDSHATDLEVARAVLRQVPGPAYVGMLGSRAKSAEIRAQLEQDGIPPQRLGALRCPVGLPLGGRSPGLVALSILAEVVAFHHGRLAEARGRLGGNAP